MIAPTAMRMTPIMTVTAAATDRTMTRRTLLVVAVSERTAQRSHRGYRPASQMASCNHYDRHSGGVTGRPNGVHCARAAANVLARHYSFMNGTGFRCLE